MNFFYEIWINIVERHKLLKKQIMLNSKKLV